MATIDLNLVRAALAVHDSGSFSGAAQRLGVPRSTVSRAVAALEDALGVLLFQRTTRQVATTPAGIALIDRVRPELSGLERALSELPGPDAPSGTLRLTTTPDLGANFLAEVVSRFAARYPLVDVDVHLSTTLVDLVAGGFDLALRIASRPQRDSSLVARKVGVVALQLFAAPSYLARKGTPRSVGELSAYERVSLRGVPWPGNERAKRKLASEPVPRVMCNDMFFLRALIRSGGGIGALPTFLASDDLAAGTLVRVLPRWSLATGAVYLVHPASKHVPRRVTAFQELAIESLRLSPLARAPS